MGYKMKNLILLLVICKIISVSLSAQNIKGANEFFRTNNITLKPVSDTSLIDPYSFFPSQVGDFWQYKQASSLYLREYCVTKDSVLSDESRYIYYDDWYLYRPTYMLTTDYMVVFDPENWRPEKRYNLNAKIDEKWWVREYYEDTVFVSGQQSILDTIYEGSFLGRNAIFKVIKNYYVSNDNDVLVESWDHDVVLASGMGLVYKDMDSEAPKVLISAIIDGDTLGTLVNVEKEIITTKPSDFALSQNYPNPFNPSTTIKYQIPNDGMVSLRIYDVTGQEVKTLVNQAQSRGRYEVNFDASNLSSGVYFYRIQSGSFTKSMKMIILK